MQDSNYATGVGAGAGAGAGGFNNQAGTGMGNQTGNGDMLDRGVDYAERREGHELKPSTTEKISDGIRTGFKKMTGKDIPIQDKQYS